jgi:two-component system OmpR family sensor kinase
MMNTSYRDRIAKRFTLVTSGIILLVFGIIYLVVEYTVVQNIDRELRLEVEEHAGEIFLVKGEIRFAHKDEWQEMEHSQIQLNPIFIEIVDLEGNSMDKSPNLRENRLSFFPERAVNREAWTLKTGGYEVRQMQIPLQHAGKTEGYLLVATSFEDARTLLDNLRNILLLLYPCILISLFLSMRYLAGKSIDPIRKIIQKTNQITQTNLNERVPETPQNDEIGQLTRSINKLLSRLEQALLREKQFTSDASHELRTPLSVLRGTLEVLIRKPRTADEYVTKIQTALQSIDRMSDMIDQLLALARVEIGPATTQEEVELITFLEEIADRLTEDLGRKIEFRTEVGAPIFVQVNEKSLMMMIRNLVENAVKYSKFGNIVLETGWMSKGAFISVIDQGIGIDAESISKIFDPFYRDPEVINQLIPGTGLGLAIVQKLALETGIELEVTSQKGKGSTFKLIFVREDLSKS